LCAYCVGYARWFTAKEILLRMAAHDPVTHALVVKASDGNPRADPLVRIASRAADSMVKFAGEFGMTAAARSKVAAGPFGRLRGDRKFGGLLG
jgi:P27 family predicted phage terminase small subunit